MDSNTLLMRVRIPEKKSDSERLMARTERCGEGRSQLQIPLKVYRGYFDGMEMEGDPEVEVVSSDDGVARFLRRCPHRQGPSFGKPHTIKLSDPKLMGIQQPVVLFWPQNGKFYYKVRDGLVDGVEWYNRLKAGLETGITKTSVKDWDKATWWQEIDDINLPVSAPVELVSPVEPKKSNKRTKRPHVVRAKINSFADNFVHDSEIVEIRKSLKANRKKQNNKQLLVQKGFIYIISHPEHTGKYGYISIGKSCDYYTRIGGYLRGDLWRAHKLEWALKFSNMHEAEDIIHAILDPVRIDNGGEWFKITIPDAIKLIEKVHQEIN